MKKINHILLGTAFLAAIAFTTSCKKETEPGPAGADGNVLDLRYKQKGTTIKLSGIYSSDASAFDNTYKLSYFSSLDENSVVEETVELEEEPEARTSETGTGYFYHIVRRDSLNNSVLSFDIAFYAGDDEPVIKNLNIDIITNITSAGYKRIATGYVQDIAISGNTANGYFQKGYLDNSDLEYYSDLVISAWNYNTTTRELSFELSGTLADVRNSTRNELTIEAHVSADLNHETHRIGKE